MKRKYLEPEICLLDLPVSDAIMASQEINVEDLFDGDYNPWQA